VGRSTVAVDEEVLKKLGVLAAKLSYLVSQRKGKSVTVSKKDLVELGVFLLENLDDEDLVKLYFKLLGGKK